MNVERVAQIRTKLNDAFAPQRLDIVDESHKHAGHEGARSGGGHFNVMIVAEAFTGQTLIQRHRMIYTALGEELKQAIHALSIKAYTPTEI
jgi:BolA family transcriptional regulator, general stress-responsive regulator